MNALRQPPTLREAEADAWRSIVASLGGPEALEPSDGPLLTALAILTARLEDIRSHLEPVDGTNDYLMAVTVRGTTGNPLLGHERETIKEIRLLHERLTKILAERNSNRPQRPKSLREMRESLTLARPTKTG